MPALVGFKLLTRPMQPHETNFSWLTHLDPLPDHGALLFGAFLNVFQRFGFNSLVNASAVLETAVVLGDPWKIVTRNLFFGQSKSLPI